MLTLIYQHYCFTDFYLPLIPNLVRPILDGFGCKEGGVFEPAEERNYKGIFQVALIAHKFVFQKANFRLGY